MYFTIMHHADDLDVRIIKELGGSNLYNNEILRYAHAHTFHTI